MNIDLLLNMFDSWGFYFQEDDAFIKWMIDLFD